jgi:hypothetical protein
VVDVWLELKILIANRQPKRSGRAATAPQTSLKLNGGHRDRLRPHPGHRRHRRRKRRHRHRDAGQVLQMVGGVLRMDRRQNARFLNRNLREGIQDLDPSPLDPVAYAVPGIRLSPRGRD